MHIGILVTGQPDPEGIRLFGDYGHQTHQFLQGQQHRFSIFDVVNRALPEAATCEGYVITGSVAAAYDVLPWIVTLKDWLRRTHERGIPLVGLCFGHQIMAQALGGRCEKNPKGWEMGWVTLQINTTHGPWPLPLGLLQMHQDHVVTPIPGTEIILSSELTQMQVYRKGSLLLGIQGHPEFSADMVRHLIHRRFAEGHVSQSVADEALQSLGSPVDRSYWRSMIMATLEQTSP